MSEVHEEIDELNQQIRVLKSRLARYDDLLRSVCAAISTANAVGTCHSIAVDAECDKIRDALGIGGGGDTAGNGGE